VLAVVAVGVVMVLRLALVGSGGGPLTITGSSSVVRWQNAAARIYVVQPGDTLWSIARVAGAHGDPRPIVDQLAAQVGDRQLQPGQQLVLPAGP
jgi:LysM repeat protein